METTLRQRTISLLIAATETAIQLADFALAYAAGHGDDEAGARYGIERAKYTVDLACLHAARASRAGADAQVRYFPDRETICVAVGDDQIAMVESIPPEFGRRLTRRAQRVLAEVGYRMRPTLLVGQTHHPESFVIADRANAAAPLLN